MFLGAKLKEKANIEDSYAKIVMPMQSNPMRLLLCVDI